MGKTETISWNRQGCPLSPLLFNILGILGIPRHSNKAGRRNKMNTNRYRRSQTITVCRWHNLIPRISEKLHQKTPRYHRQL
jgi:hypothetical protein